MPLTVIVGGQYGSEGKGKVAHFLAREMRAAAAVRVGGPNSGHTVIGPNGEAVIFRQLPTAALLPEVKCVIGCGSYIDVDCLLEEIKRTSLPVDRVVIDPHAVLITEEDRCRERELGLRDRIGSTLSGTGSAFGRRISREITVKFAKDDPRLASYIRPTMPLLREFLDGGERVIIEGTQGFGLSVFHGSDYPNVTSRDTTAAGFLSEVGLSPFDVDDIVLVIRAFPIRVAGNSGKLPEEIDWATVTAESGSQSPLSEHTSVTGGLRRVARFDSEVVAKAIQANRPTRIVLNHLDYVDAEAQRLGRPTEIICKTQDPI